MNNIIERVKDVLHEILFVTSRELSPLELLLRIHSSSILFVLISKDDRFLVLVDLPMFIHQKFEE